MAAETKRVLIVVRTYPTPAKKGIEVSCTAAITEDGQWVRIFPVPFRFLENDQKFRRYQWVDVTVEKSSDARPESYKLQPNGIQIISEPLSSDQEWAERKKHVLPLRAHCLCCLVAERDKNQSPTLGIFKPRIIKRLILKADDAEWTEEQLQILRQQQLFAKAPKDELEKVPFTFKYEFQCDHDECPGHTLSCTDWEMGQAWRLWRDKYGDAGWEAKFRERFEQEMIEKFDTHFYVGTVHKHPSKWIIVGLFYPPMPTPKPLLELMGSGMNRVT